jgi:hypothetical protein
MAPVNPVRLDASPGSGGSIFNGDLPNFSAGVARDIITSDAVIDNRVVIADDVIIHHCRVVINIARPHRRDDMIGEAAVDEMPRRNKAKMVFAQSKAEIDADIPTKIREPNSGVEP